MRLLRKISNWICVLLCCLLLWNPARTAAQTEVIPSGIQLLVIEGEGAINRLGQRATREPIGSLLDRDNPGAYRPLTNTSSVAADRSLNGATSAGDTRIDGPLASRN